MATAVIDTPTYLASPGLSVIPEFVSGGGVSTETPCRKCRDSRAPRIPW